MGTGRAVWGCRWGLLRLPAAETSDRERARWGSYQIVSGFVLKTHFKRRLELLKFSVEKVQRAPYAQLFSWSQCLP